MFGAPPVLADLPPDLEAGNSSTLRLRQLLLELARQCGPKGHTMQRPVGTEAPAPLASLSRISPRFSLIERQPLRPQVILLAMVVAVAAAFGVAFVLAHASHRRLLPGSYDAAQGAGRGASASGADDDDDDKDDPNQIDTIVLGDPSEAPVPARKGNHVSPVHPTILIFLPRSGSQTGLIPDTASGRLLYAWLAGFNQASYPALRDVLPTAASDSTAAAQIELRKQTGGFNLLSAKEAQLGVLVFRLLDQSPSGIQALGTLQVLAGSNPPRIGSFSLSSIAPPPPEAPPASHTPAP